MSSKDVYAETLDYIRKIENEIVFSLDENHVYDPSHSIDNFCDILLEKIRKELDITSFYEKNVEQSFAELSDVHKKEISKDLVSKVSSKGSKDDFVNIRSDENDISKDIDNEYNYRYSFYDNSNNIFIYFADSALITKVLGRNNKILYSDIQNDNDGLFLPSYVENALIYLSKFGKNSVGLFRKSGVKSRINMLKDHIYKGEDVKFDTYCVYDVADFVKTWLRELKPHLITTDLIDRFANNTEEFSLSSLGDSHRYVLYVILHFLAEIASNSKQNQMNAYNLAICFTPSLCECETEGQIVKAQKCLLHCIENYKALFYIPYGANVKRRLVLNQNRATIVVNASASDILNRILYERNKIDPLISKWSIKRQTSNSDEFEFSLQFSSLLPSKTFVLKREWNCTDGVYVLYEKAGTFISQWHLSPKGQGQTQVSHDVSLELGGFSQQWYASTFAHIHKNQMHKLASSFEITLNNNAHVSQV